VSTLKQEYLEREVRPFEQALAHIELLEAGISIDGLPLDQIPSTSSLTLYRKQVRRRMSLAAVSCLALLSLWIARPATQPYQPYQPGALVVGPTQPADVYHGTMVYNVVAKY
jgi:hypothetical protein